MRQEYREQHANIYFVLQLQYHGIPVPASAHVMCDTCTVIPSSSTEDWYTGAYTCTVPAVELLAIDNTATGTGMLVQDPGSWPGWYG